MNAREAQARIKELEAKLAAGPAQRGSVITLKVGEKGGICMYGLQQRPVTLYANQWQRVKKVLNDEGFQRFVEEHRGELSEKKEAKSGTFRD